VAVVKVRYATVRDIQQLVQFSIQIKEQKDLLSDIPIVPSDLGFWFADCITTPGIYVFVAEDKDEITGFIVLTEMVTPWNRQHRYLTDLLFVAQKGGLKLLRTAKALAKKKGHDKLLLSTSSKEERSDRFFNKVSQQIGGVYELKV